jgi:hypothetical protein
MARRTAGSRQRYGCCRKEECGRGGGQLGRVKLPLFPVVGLLLEWKASFSRGKGHPLLQGSFHFFERTLRAHDPPPVLQVAVKP